MMPIAGYADRLSVRPGETIAFKVANATGAPLSARIVRVVSADPNPAGPGIVLEPTDARVEMIAAPQRQGVQQGSYATARLTAPMSGSAVKISALVFPTGAGGRRRGVISLASGDLVLDLAIAADGHAEARLASDTGTATARTPRALASDGWYRLAATFDLAAGTVRVEARETGAGSAAMTGEARTHGSPKAAGLGGASVLIAAAHGAAPRDHFDGRIEAPRIEYGEGRVIAAWDFSKEMHTQRIVDTGPHGQHGTLVNSPTRAMRGSTWSGREHCFRHAPGEYAAIHFHSDDIDDCHWPTTHTFTPPADLRSGIYALILEGGGAGENIPFFVVPPKGKPSARIAVLASTFTYVVYHNHTRPEWSNNPGWVKQWKDQAASWPGAYPHGPGDHREYGLSTYNFHGDGSGIHLASWHRPMLTMRVGYITYPDPSIRGSGLRHFPADTHLTMWLEKMGFDYDIITDWELHHEGLALLKPYRVVMTGSHPEYHTAQMLDALEAYRDGGGRLMYMGGNGFYWKIALSQEKPGQIEIRRAEGGIRAWAAEPGEYYNQLDGEYGGLWRRNARPPQKLVGVGFTAQGNFVGSYYRVKDEARRDQRVAWILDRVPEEKIGDFGLSGHGAAGFELDRVDYRLGTPRHAVVIAASENHPPEAPWVLVPEEQLTHLMTWSGQPSKQLIRADMTFFETPNNGAVFSTGSITYCGSLPVNNFDNDVSRLTLNVLRRFLDDSASFPLPDGA